MAIRRSCSFSRWFVAILIPIIAITASAQRNPWVRESKVDRGVIVFVHGVTGDARGTWSSGNSYWPEMLTHDPTFDGQGVFVYSYQSPKIGSALSIDELAQNMWSTLTAEGVLNHREISFVSHSMGGIVTRAFILKHRDQIAPKIRMLYFLATPGNGNALAQVFSLVSPNPQFEGVTPLKSGAYLAHLESDWLGAKLGGLKAYCGYETKGVSGRFIVVDMASATRLCSMVPDAIDADHISIAKPKDSHSPQYLAVKAAFIDSAPPPPLAKAAPTTSTRVLNPAASPAEAALSAELAKLQRTSIEKHDRFTTGIPFIFSEGRAEIPINGNPKDPLNRTYSVLSGIAQFHPDTNASGAARDWSGKTSAAAQLFVARVLQCYLLRSIFEMQDPPTTWSYNDHDGLTTNAPPPIYVPDQETYPREQWAAQIDSLGIDYWKPNNHNLPLLSVPASAVVSLTTDKLSDAAAARYVIRIERKPEFTLTFSLTPTMNGNRALPRNFELLRYLYRGEVETYIFDYVVEFEFTWNGDRDKGARYQEWALGLDSGMKQRLVAKAPE